MSAKAPAFQFYAAEYLADADVQMLTLEQEGIYIRLLAYCWREGSLPAEDVKLARLCKGCSIKALPDVKHLFEEENGRLTHGRLDRERRKQEEFRNKQANNGSKGGRPNREAIKAAKASVGIFKPNPEETQALIDGIAEVEPKKSSAFASSSSASALPPNPPQGGQGERDMALGYWRQMRDEGRPIYHHEAPSWAKKALDEDEIKGDSHAA